MNRSDYLVAALIGAGLGSMVSQALTGHRGWGAVAGAALVTGAAARRRPTRVTEVGGTVAEDAVARLERGQPSRLLNLFVFGPATFYGAIKSKKDPLVRYGLILAGAVSTISSAKGLGETYLLRRRLDQQRARKGGSKPKPLTLSQELAASARLALSAV